LTISSLETTGDPGAVEALGESAALISERLDPLAIKSPQ
jgi:hypothetical protein